MFTPTSAADGNASVSNEHAIAASDSVHLADKYA